jgi:predicted transposase/invertase (TIGR01784 family)
LNKLDRIPVELKENIFLKLFKTAEIAKFSKSEYNQYQESMNAYRDIKNSIDTAFEKGENKGKIEIAKKMLNKGIDILLIVEMTGLTEKQINDLKNE